jgi:hypothetical protein
VQQFFSKNNKVLLFRFKANRWLSKETESFIDLLPEESSHSIGKDIPYIITVMTSSEDNSSTDSDVFMTIYGEKNRTKEFQLIKSNQNSESLFKQGQISVFQIELNDVGIVGLLLNFYTILLFIILLID